MKYGRSIILMGSLSLLLVACSDSSDDPVGVAPGSDVSVPNDPANPEGPGAPAPNDPDNGGNDPADDPVNDPDGDVTGEPQVSNEPLPLEPAPRPVTPDLPAPQVPVLADPTAPATPSPDPDDPFGFGLEFNGESPVAGGPPTQPRNLRLELVSNDWAEINWAPSNDDGEVVQYTIRRDDGVVYEIREDQTDIAAGSQREIDKYWTTTSFIDCNYTRFAERLHTCTDGRQPRPGQTFIYTVTATDDEGQESIESEPLSVTYLETSNAPVPLYEDIYKSPENTFVHDNDLSAVDYWLDDNFQLVFQDEFNGDELDLRKWQTRLTWGDEVIINGEQQYFVNIQEDSDFGYNPFKFTGESLIIEAIPVPDDLRANLPEACEDETRPGVDQCEFLSGALSSYDRFQHLYGYTEGRFKVSGGFGALSSFYLYHRYKGTGTAFHAPEIDIIEYLGENPFGDEDAFQTYHYESPGNLKRSSPTMGYKKEDGGIYADGEWHTFGVLWEPQLVVWYIDGREVKRLAGPQVSRQPMNVVNYLVAGSGWAPTPNNPADFPLQFEADYIRVYQRDAYASTATFGPPQQ